MTKAWLGKVALGLFAALLVIAIGLQVWQEKSNRAATAPGVQAPDFRITRLEGGEVSLSELKGKIVLVDFWATWCPPCREELPYLVKLAKEFESQGVVLIAANDEGAVGSPDFVHAWINRTIPDLAPYTAFANPAMTSAYKLEVMPTLVFIDREGQIRETVTGAIPERAIRRRIEQLL